MQLLFINQWFSGEIARALGWTLIHSLWQGVLAAVLAGIIIITTRKSTAGLRYNLLGSVLILFLIAATITFCKEINNQHNPVAAVTGLNGSAEETSLLTITDGEIAQLPVSYIDAFTAWFNDRAQYIILLWMIFVAVNCIKLFTGLAALNRLRNYKTHAVSVEWKAKFDSLRKSIGLKQSVIFLQSELTKVPIAVGFFKPVIFVPLGLLAHLPADQVETILLHELAHIRRRDFMVNLLQRFTEAIFFFNPGLIWISSLIRQEREACCDDIVVANTTHQRSYLEALVSFQEYTMTAPAYAMGIGSRKNYLFNRVKRLLTRENKKLEIMEKIVLVAGILVLTAFTFIPEEKEKKEVSNTRPNSVVIAPQKESAAALPSSAMWAKVAKVNKKKNKKPVVVPTVTIDSLPPKAATNYDDLQFPGISNNINDDGKTRTQTTIATDQNGKKYTITKLNGKVTSLTVDGNNIPEKDFDNYNSLVQRVDATTHGNKVRSQKEIEERRAQTEQKQKEREKRLEESKMERERDLKEIGKQREERQDRMEEARKERKKEIDQTRKERENEIKEKERERKKDDGDRKKRDKERTDQERVNEREREEVKEKKEVQEKKEKPEKRERKEKPEKREKKERDDEGEEGDNDDKGEKGDKTSQISIQNTHQANNDFNSEYKLNNDTKIKLNKTNELKLNYNNKLEQNLKSITSDLKIKEPIKLKPRTTLSAPQSPKPKLFSQTRAKLFT